MNQLFDPLWVLFYQYEMNQLIEWLFVCYFVQFIWTPYTVHVMYQVHYLSKVTSHPTATNNRITFQKQNRFQPQ